MNQEMNQENRNAGKGFRKVGIGFSLSFLFFCFPNSSIR